MPEAALSELAVYRARPTIRIDGLEELRVSDLLIGMEMTENEEGLSALELRFSNIASDPQGKADFAFEDDIALSLGRKVTVYGGDESDPQEIFRGMISGFEGDFPEMSPPELVVLAEDALQKARMNRRTKTYIETTISDIVNQVAEHLSLRTRITGFTTNIGTWVQLNESDLAFLRRILARYDGEVQIVGEELHVSPRGEIQRGLVELQLHSQLRSAYVIADLANQVTTTTVTGWDPIQGRQLRAQSLGKDIGPGKGRTGAATMQIDFIPRSHQISHLAVTTQEEAQAVADAAFDKRARRFVCVTGKAEGNPALRIGTHVKLSGLGPRFDNTYYIVGTCHRYDVESGYETEFEAECAFLGGE